MFSDSIFKTIERKITALPRSQAAGIIAASLLVVAAFDYLIGASFSLIFFYVVPISIAAWAFDEAVAILVSAVSTLAVIWTTTLFYLPGNLSAALWNGTLIFAFFALFSIVLGSLKRELRARDEALKIIEIDKERAVFISQHDILTGLPNRASFHAELGRAIAEARKNDSQFHVMFIDVDHFKRINDNYGHYAGDLFLKGIASALKENMQPELDLLARLSGDEFGVICRSHENAEGFALHLLQKASQPIVVDAQTVSTSISIGVATYPDDANELASILVCADLAMYQAKRSGRSNVRRYTRELASVSARRHNINQALKKAIQADLLELHYQPVFCADINHISSVEVLLRCTKLDIPFLTTSEAIAIAEESGMISELGEWVLHRACLQARNWNTSLGFAPPIAVNISSQDFRSKNIVERINFFLQEYKLNASSLRLELTERIVMENSEESRNALNALKGLGIHISVDDFGTGYSSLGYLKSFSIDSLKIDQLFVQGLPNNSQDVAITTAIIRLALGLGVDVVAEGIENQAQLDFLKKHGCNHFQGYFLAMPLPPEELFDKLRHGVWKIAERRAD